MLVADVEIFADFGAVVASIRQGADLVGGRGQDFCDLGSW
jgi:hypothetical protein